MANAAVLPAETDRHIRDLKSVVGSTRRTLRWTWVGVGVGLFVGLTTVVLLAAAGLDLIVVLPDWARWAAFAAVTGTAAAALLWRVAAPMFKRLSILGTALRIEKTMPDVHNRLVTVLDLSARPQDDSSAPFFSAVVSQTVERVQGFRVARVLDLASVRKSAWWAIVPAAILTLSYAAFPRFVGTALQRIAMPWADIPPASWLTIAVQPGDAAILAGEPANIAVDVAGGAPEEIRLKLIDESDAARTVTLKRSDSGYSYPIEKLEQSLRYRVYAGRTWTREYRLDRVTRPEILAAKLTILPPAYASDAPRREHPFGDSTITAVAGSTIAVELTGSDNTDKATLGVATERIETRVIADDRNSRWLVRDDLPAGAWAFGDDWNWDWSQKFRRTRHTRPHEGDKRHGLGFNPPVPVRADDVFFMEVFVDPTHAPQQILIEANDGSWEHRAYWGVDKLRKAGDKTGPENRPMGALPRAGEWVRLEIPARQIGMEGKLLREIAFCVFDGSLRWNWLGVCTGKVEETRHRDSESETPLVAKAGVWSGTTPVEKLAVMTLQLRDSAGHGVRQPPEFRLVPVADKPPTVRVDAPARDVVLSKPEAVKLVARAADDVALDRVELVIGKAGAPKPTVHPLWKAERHTASQQIRGEIPASLVGGNPGDTFVYRLRATDKKGLSAESAEYRIQLLPNDFQALDRQQKRFDEMKRKLTEKIADLAKQEQRIAEKAATIAQKTEPKPAPTENEKPAAKEKEKSANADSAKNADAPERSKDSPTQDGKQESASDAEKTDRPEANADRPPAGERKSAEKSDASKPLDARDRQELQQLANDQKRVENSVRETAEQLKQLAQAPEAAAVSPNTLDTLADVARDLEKNAAPDAKQAVKDLQDAAKSTPRNTPNDSSAPNAAKASTAQTKRDLDRAVAKLERAKKLENASDDDRPEVAEMRAQQQAEQDASDAAEDLDNARLDLNRLRAEVAAEQKTQDRLKNEAEAAEDEGDLKRVGDQQNRLEDEARQTLQDVQEALGGATPEDIAPEDGEGMEKRKSDGDKPEDGQQGENPSTPGGAQTPNEGAKKAGESPNPQDGEQPGGKAGTTPGDQKRAGEKGAPGFESLKKGKSKGKGRGGKGQPGEGEMREDLAKRQDGLARDLERAAKAIDGKNGEFAKSIKGLKEALGDAEKTSKMLGEPNLQEQLALAKHIQNMRAMRGKVQGSQAKGKPGDPRGAGKAAQEAAAGQDPSLAEGLAGMKLQPQDRAELLQGSKAPTPESYKPYVRDYYNRLTETKPKQ